MEDRIFFPPDREPYFIGETKSENACLSKYFFRKTLKQAGLKYECINNNTTRKHQFEYASKVYVTHSLTAPSGAANRSIGSSQAYKAAKLENPKYTTFDFRVEQYGRVFLNVPEKTKST